MRTVTSGATGLEVTPLANGSWQFRGDWGPVDERAAIEAAGPAGSPGTNFSGTAPAYGACNSLLTNACSYIYGEQRAAHSYRLVAALEPVGPRPRRGGSTSS